MAAYEWLLAQGIPAGSVCFMGDSAGGGLALATMLAARDRGFDLPAGAAVMSPWTDLSCSGPSFVTNLGREALAPRGSWTVFAKHALGGADPRAPSVSPLFADLRGLPPLLIHVGGDEVMRADSTDFAARAQAAGMDVRLHVGPGLFHCYPVCAPMFPEAKAAMDDICAFAAAIPRRR